MMPITVFVMSSTCAGWGMVSCRGLYRDWPFAADMGEDVKKLILIFFNIVFPAQNNNCRQAKREKQQTQHIKPYGMAP
jgi:hypothetical protein